MDLTLHIRLFGELSIKNEFSSLENGKRQNQQVIRLLSYLLANSKKRISKMELIDILWGEDDCNNPDGALRNLIYRARKELTKLFPENYTGDTECIHYSHGTYVWEPSVDYEIDIETFDDLITKATRQENSELRYQYCDEALGMYKKEFLPSQADMEWAIVRSVYYRNLFVKCVVMMCDIKNEQKDYEGVINICEQALLVDKEDEAIHCEKIKAYLNLGMVIPALDYYHSIAPLFPADMQSDEMKAVYKQLAETLPSEQNDIEKLEDSLKIGQQTTGTFYCDYDIFRNIYQINVRSIRRSQKQRYLVLISLTDTLNPGIITSDLGEELDNIKYILSTCLRATDVYTQSSATQFAVLLLVTNEAGLKVALNRIMDRYNKKIVHKNVICRVESKVLT